MRKTLSIINLIAYIAMMVVNGLANALPINGYTTGEVSDMYPNLFTPDGFTFSIWGLIYLLLGVFVIRQVIDAFKKNDTSVYTSQLGWYFVVSCALNASWIVVWHHKMLIVSLLLMFGLLFTLRAIYMRLRRVQVDSGSEEFLFKVPFRIYLGWISVASIANTAAFLVDKDWAQWGLTSEFWYVTVLTVAVALGLFFLFRLRDIAYALVIIWAFIGITSARSSDFSVDGIVMMAPLTGIVVLSLSVVYTAFMNNRRG